MENIKKIISWPVILGIQVITTVVLLFFIFKLNILPTTYAVMVGMILVLLGFISFALMKPNKKEHHRKTKPREIIGKVISLLLSVLMVFGSVMINKGYSTLDDITNSNTKSTHYAIVVLKSSKINSLSELQNESIEYCLQYDKEKDMNQVIAEAKKKESSLNFDVAMTYSKLGDDLYNNTVNAILINTAYNGMFEENHPDFQNEVKEIWTSDIETKVKDFSTRVSVTNTPFIIYNIPQLSGTILTMSLYKNMLKNPNVLGVKNSSIATQDIQMFKTEAGKDHIVFNGPDEQFISGRAIGADGGIGGTYAVMPELFLKMNEFLEEGKMKEALEIQNKADAIIYKMCEAHGNLYAVMKEILRINENIDIGNVRKPLPGLIPEDIPIVEEAAKMIRDAISELQ
mgnify:CR=1 FL=1